jgi:DNA (cytosine-5)-methyltransferase 1
MSIIFHGENVIWEEEYRRPVRVMSTFSGIGAASISWQPNEWIKTPTGKINAFDFVAYSEIDPFPCHVLHYRRGASRPKYMPDPEEEGLSDEDRDARAKNIDKVSNLPETGVTNFGDITQITDDDLRRLGSVDVLEGGPPCQTFSLAGARNGLNDPRGNMVVRFCELAERMRKINGLRFVVWENVHGALSDKTNVFGYLLAALAGVPGCLDPKPGEEATKLEPPDKPKWGWKNAGRVLGPSGRSVAWRTVQAAHWGIPQRRKRVFAIANFGTGPRGLGSNAAESILFEPDGSLRDIGQGLKTRQAVVATYRSRDRLEYRSAADRYRDPKVRARLEAESSKDWFGTGLSTGNTNELTAQNEDNPKVVAYALADDYDPKASKDTAYALLAGSRSGGGRKQMVVHPKISGTRYTSEADSERIVEGASEDASAIVAKPIVIVSPEESGTLYARAAAPIGKSSHHKFVVITKDEGDENPENWTVRYFTPLECERLQGFPDHWTDVPFKGALVADGHRYKAIGNSMPCPVMAYIGDRLEAVLEIEEIFESDPDLLAKLSQKKPGRPPANGVSPMSAAERQRRRRERLRQAALSEKRA